jgi:hypothetical protein
MEGAILVTPQAGPKLATRTHLTGTSKELLIPVVTELPSFIQIITPD